MVDFDKIEEKEQKNYENSSKVDKYQSIFKKNSAKGLQFFDPYFEFSYACAGCGETPYIKILTQLFGDKMIVANATGCSSIYGGSYPVCPYAKDKKAFDSVNKPINPRRESNPIMPYSMRLDFIEMPPLICGIFLSL